MEQNDTSQEDPQDPSANETDATVDAAESDDHATAANTTAEVSEPAAQTETAEPELRYVREEPRDWADELIAEARINAEPADETISSSRRWRRSRNDRLVAGVAATLADRAGLPLWLVRFGFVISAFFGGFGIAVYLASWALMPDEHADRSLTDEWRLRFEQAESTSQKMGVVLIGVAVVLAIGVTGAVAAPLTMAALLVFVGMALMLPVEN